MSDAAGTAIETSNYMPFGGMRAHSGISNSNYKFTDQEFYGESGLYNYDARLYDPVIGRFISADSIVPDPFNPQSLNRYSYCLNNPLIYVDPTGHFNDQGNDSVDDGVCNGDVDNPDFGGSEGENGGGGGYNSSNRDTPCHLPDVTVIGYPEPKLNGPEGGMRAAYNGAIFGFRAAGIVAKETSIIVALDVIFALTNYLPLPPRVSFWTGRALSGYTIHDNFTGMEQTALQISEEIQSLVD